MIQANADDQRWRPFKNCESRLTIPAFGLISLADTGPAFHHELDNGRVILGGKRPTSTSAGLQDAYLLACNGPTVVKPGKYGLCTQDWPCRVLHNGAIDGLGVGSKCGPAADLFYVMSTGDAFVCLSHEIENVVETPKTGGYNNQHCVWIAPNTRPRATSSSFQLSGNLAANLESLDKILTLTQLVVGSSDFSWDATLGGVKCASAGTYVGAAVFSYSLASDAVANQLTGMRFIYRPSAIANWSQTSCQTTCTALSLGTYPGYFHPIVSITVPWRVTIDAGSALNFLNISAWDIVPNGFFAWGMKSAYPLASSWGN